MLPWSLPQYSLSAVFNADVCSSTLLSSFTRLFCLLSVPLRSWSSWREEEDSPSKLFSSLQWSKPQTSELCSSNRGREPAMRKYSYRSGARSAAVIVKQRTERTNLILNIITVTVMLWLMWACFHLRIKILKKVSHNSDFFLGILSLNLTNVTFLSEFWVKILWL